MIEEDIIFTVIITINVIHTHYLLNCFLLKIIFLCIASFNIFLFLISSCVILFLMCQLQG